MKTRNLIIAATLFIGTISSCSSILDIDAPNDSMTDKNVYTTEESIGALAHGLYVSTFSQMFHLLWIDLFTGSSSDELSFTSSSYDDFTENSYTPTTSYINSFWTNPYATIYHCNDFIINVENNPVVSEEKRNLYLGEAYYFRAYSYFLLINLFGDVPLVLTNIAEDAILLPRTAKNKVYEQIISDFKFAEIALKDSGNPNTKITQKAVKAMLARVYLYTEQWQLAITKANEIIPVADGGSGTDKGFELEDVENIFRHISSETILANDNKDCGGLGSYDGYIMLSRYFISKTKNPPSFRLTTELGEAMLEDPKDLRKNWVKVYGEGDETVYAFSKFKNLKKPSLDSERELQILLRLTEQYLIRAEAKAHLNDNAGAIVDINKIRARAGVDPLESGADNETVLLAIEKERRKEFFIEEGHRWFDMNRTGRADVVFGAMSSKKWNPEREGLWPIPEKELGSNVNLLPNPGY